MSTRPTRLLTCCALAMALGYTGCSKKPAPTGVAIRNQDGSITNPDGTVTYPAGSPQAQQAAGGGPKTNADGSVTNADGSITYPASSAQAQSEKNGTPLAAPSTAAAPAPVPAPTPAPAPAETAGVPEAPVERKPVEPRSTTLPSGTRVAVSLSQSLSAKASNVGDTFTGVVAQPVTTASGRTIFARGTQVAGTVVASKGRGRFKGAGALGIQLTTISGQTVTTSEYEQEEKGKGKRTGVLTGGGAGLGAIIGGIAGGGKGALIGGLAGGGAGAAGSGLTGNKDIVIPAETVITFRLTAPLTVR